MGSPDPQCRDGQRPKLSGWMHLAALRAALLAAAAGVGWLGDLLRRMMGRSCRGIRGGEGAKRDPFEVLGLQGGMERSTMEEATKARRKLALKWHPDRNIGNEEEATKKMQEINAAYNEVERILSAGSNGDEDDAEASESGEEGSNDTRNRTGNEEKKQKKREYREQQRTEKHREQKMKEEFSRFQKAHRAAQRGAFASSDNAAGGKQNVAPRQKGVKNRGTTKGAKKRAKKRAKKEEQKREQAWEKKRQEYAHERSHPGMNEDAPDIASTAKKRTPFHRLSPEMRCGIKFGSKALLKTPVFTAIRARTLNILHLGLQAMRKHACDPIPLPEEGVIVTPLHVACYLGDGAAAHIIIQMIGGRWAEAVTAKTQGGDDCLELAVEAQDVAKKLYEEAQTSNLEGMATKKDLERQQKVVEERRKALEEATDLVGRISTLHQFARKKRRKRNVKVYSAISVVCIILPGSFYFYPDIATKLAVLLATGLICWAAPAIWVRLRIFAILLEFFIKVICLVIGDVVFAK